MRDGIRLRLESWMRDAVLGHAQELKQVVGHDVSLAGAVRDLISRAVKSGAADAAYLSGYKQGWLKGYGDGKAAGFARSPGGRIRPQPSDDNDDYRSGGKDGER